MISIAICFDDPQPDYPLSITGSIRVIDKRSETDSIEQNTAQYIEAGYHPILLYFETIGKLVELCDRTSTDEVVHEEVPATAGDDLHLLLSPEGMLTIYTEKYGENTFKNHSTNSDSVQEEFTQYCESWIEAYKQIDCYVRANGIDPDHPELMDIKEECRILSQCIER